MDIRDAIGVSFSWSQFVKELRKKIRLSQQIEIQSKEMEERLKQAKEQEQIQESSGKQRREEERKR